MSTTTSKTQPALVGGVVIGVLSALPIISAANICCCLWIIGGGVLAAYLLQQNSPEPMEQGDAALVGLLAGLVGACVWLVISIPVTLIAGPPTRRILQVLLENSENVPPAFREAVERANTSGLNIARLIIGFCFFLVIGSIFATIGGLLGAVFFRKSPPAPPSAGAAGPIS